MAIQDDLAAAVSAIVAAIQKFETDVTAAVAAAGNPALTSAVQSAIATLTSTTQGVITADGAIALAPAPAPAPAA